MCFERKTVGNFVESGILYPNEKFRINHNVGFAKKVIQKKDYWKFR